MEPGPAAIRGEDESRAERALLRLAGRYIWWKTPEEAARYPDRVLAQVMDIGTFEDCRAMRAAFGDERLRSVMRRAEPGWFRARSWAFWQAALGIDAGPRPVRRKLPPAPWERGAPFVAPAPEPGPRAAGAPLHRGPGPPCGRPGRRKKGCEAGPALREDAGGIDNGRVGEPGTAPENDLPVASALDLLATKLKTILQRAAAKDYADIAALLRSGLALERGLGAARALYGPGYPPMESVRALCWFGDGDLDTLAEDDRRLLADAAAGAAGRPVPAVPLLP